MRGFKPVSAIFQTFPSTCCHCMRAFHFSNRRFAEDTAKTKDTLFLQKHRRTIIATALGGTVSVGVLGTLSDDIKHGYVAARRTGRVLTTLTVCINE